MKKVAILLVEDNEDDVELTREAMRGNKLANDLHVAADGAAALEFLRDAATPRPDLIILDLNLPKVSGYDVLREIKADPDLRLIPVVVLTTSRRDEDVVRSYALHANCFVSKPVDMAAFVAIVKHLEQFWFNVVVLPGPAPMTIETPDAAVLRRPGTRRRYPAAKDGTMPNPDRFRVLLVEDDDDDAALVTQFISELGDDEFVLERARTLKEAMAAMSANAHDVVLLDLGLPDSPDSMATIRAICAEHGDESPIVVVMTGLADDRVVELAMKDCAQNYLVKQEIASQPQAMLRAIRIAVQRHGRQRLDEIRKEVIAAPADGGRFPVPAADAAVAAAEQEAIQILRRVNRVSMTSSPDAEGTPVVDAGDVTTAIRAVEVALGSLQRRIDDTMSVQREIRADLAGLGVWARRVDEQNSRRDAEWSRTRAQVEAGRRRLSAVVRSVDGSRRRKDPGLLGRVDMLEAERKQTRRRVEEREKTVKEIVGPVVSQVLIAVGTAVVGFIIWYITQRGGK